MVYVVRMVNPTLKKKRKKVINKEFFYTLGWTPRVTQVFKRGELWLGLDPDYVLCELDYKFHARRPSGPRSRVWGVSRIAIYIIENLFIFNK